MADISPVKQNWFGSLPPGWQCWKIKYACQIRVQRSSSDDPYLGLEDLVSYAGLSDQWDPDKAKLSTGNGTLAVPGDVVFSKLRVYLAKGLVARIPLRCTTELIILNPRGVIADYLNWILKSEAFISYLNTASYGARMPRISPEFLLESAIPVPSLDEQQKISSLIGRKTTDIDELIGKMARQVELLERYRRELIARTVTRGLNPDVPMRDSGIKWIGEVPTTWRLLRIAALYDLRSQKVSDKDYPPLSITMNGVVPQLETVAKTNDGDNRKLVKAGDFVINSRSDRRGACGISPQDGSCSLINTVLAPQHSINNRYFSFLFRSALFADEFYRWGHGIHDDLWTTNWSDMKSIQVPVPPLEDQEAIANYLDSKMAEIDSTVAGINKQIELLGRYRKQVINDLVTGKVRVGEVA